jgi:hypothetical protein
VRAANVKTKNDNITIPSLFDRNKNTNTGESNILKMLNVLGKFN